MAINAQCLICQRWYSVPEEMAAPTLPCPACGSTIQLPIPASPYGVPQTGYMPSTGAYPPQQPGVPFGQPGYPAAPMQPVYPPAYPPAAFPSSERSSGLPTWMWATIGGGVGLALIVVLAVVVLDRKPKQPELSPKVEPANVAPVHPVPKPPLHVVPQPPRNVAQPSQPIQPPNQPTNSPPGIQFSDPIEAPSAPPPSTPPLPNGAGDPFGVPAQPSSSIVPARTPTPTPSVPSGNPFRPAVAPAGN